MSQREKGRFISGLLGIPHIHSGTFIWALIVIMGEKKGKMLGTARLETQYSLMSATMEEEKVEIASEKTTLRTCKWSCLH